MNLIVLAIYIAIFWGVMFYFAYNVFLV